MKKSIGVISTLMAILFLFSSCKKDSASSTTSISQIYSESELISVSSDQNLSVSSSQANSIAELSYDQEKAVEQINIILSRYESGEYPSPFFYLGNTHWTHIPETVKLPKTIQFSDLKQYSSEYQGGHNRWGNDYVSHAILPLNDNFEMEFELLIQPMGEPPESYMGADTFKNEIIDLLGSTSISEIKLANGAIITDIQFDRVTLTAEYQNFYLEGFDRMADGSITWERVNNRVLFEIYNEGQYRDLIAFLMNQNEITAVDETDLFTLREDLYTKPTIEEKNAMIIAVQPLIDALAASL